MSTKEFEIVKAATESGTPITQDQYDRLKAMNKQYVDHISKLTAYGDIKQALFFREEQLRILAVLEAVKVA